MAYTEKSTQTPALTQELTDVTYKTTQLATDGYADDASVEGAGYFNTLAPRLGAVGKLTHIYVASTLASSTVTIYGFINDGTTVTLDTSDKQVIQN
jgi:hypothetical protein